MEHQDLSRISSELRKRRLTYGYTQEQAAEKIGISYSYYVKIETCNQPPSLETAIKICDTFHLSLDELFLNWTSRKQLSPKQHSLIEELTQIDPGQLRKCRDILDTILEIKEDQDSL